MKLKFQHIDLHSSDVLEVRYKDQNNIKTYLLKVRDGLTEDSPFISTVKGPTLPTIRSLTGALHISFRSPQQFSDKTKKLSLNLRSNEWGQAPGFSASFSSLPPVCGGRILLQSTIHLDSPKLEGPTRWNLFTFKSCLLSLSNCVDFH